MWKYRGCPRPWLAASPASEELVEALNNYGVGPGGAQFSLPRKLCEEFIPYLIGRSVELLPRLGACAGQMLRENW